MNLTHKYKIYLTYSSYERKQRSNKKIRNRFASLGNQSNHLNISKKRKVILKNKIKSSKR